MELFEGFSTDIEGLRAVILTGSGDKAFCAGGDLKQRNGMTDVNAPGFGSACEVENAVNAILDHQRLDLIGLHCEIGSQERDFISYPAAIGQMIAEMAQLRQVRGNVLTHLALGGGRAVPSGDWAVQLPELASQIDQSLDDACATLHFPRPIVALSTGLAILGKQAA